MKTIFRFASLLSAAVMLFASCEGPVDTPDTPDTPDVPDTPVTEGKLTLEVDKLIIQSNGEDPSTLIVKFNDEVITEDVIIFDGKNKPMDLGSDFKFTATETGEYTFYANYKTFISNAVTVTAVSTEVPETPEDLQPSNTSFVRRVLLTKFTGQQCPACPNATAAIHKFYDENELAPYAVKAEAHTYNSDDPAFFADSFYGVQYFPTICLDWAMLTTEVTYNNVSSMIADRLEAEDAKAGISVNSVFADGALTFKVCVKAAETGQYRVGAWLLEDNIKGQQKGAPAGEENSWYHEFDDCIRIADSKSGTSYAGIKLGEIEAGKTAEKMFAWNFNDLDPVKYHPDGWKVENLKLCVFVSVPDEKGYSYIVNNVITAPINGVTQFEYK
ncbi:MAG: Omp28-related outer membrane protein [Bacteroidales bacterium]|nr:Omp28-related outer membrane protein [Bacteroidales bacterium]